MRISLRELMIVVAVAAIGLAGLKFASTEMRTVIEALTGLLLFGLLVTAVVDRGSRQAFAAGFVLCTVLYLVVAYVDTVRGTANYSTRAFGAGGRGGARCSGKQRRF
jgi:hypothetical protein